MNKKKLVNHLTKKKKNMSVITMIGVKNVRINGIR